MGGAVPSSDENRRQRRAMPFQTTRASNAGQDYRGGRNGRMRRLACAEVHVPADVRACARMLGRFGFDCVYRPDLSFKQRSKQAASNKVVQRGNTERGNCRSKWVYKNG